MDLSFLEEKDRGNLIRLLSITGNSLLLGEETHSKTLRSLEAGEFLESCRYLGEQHLAVAAQSKSDDQLLACLFAAAKQPNQGVSSR
jgi:hypothetical protein